jgi:hypothetical protein
MRPPASEGVDSGPSHCDSGCAWHVSSILAFVGVGLSAERFHLGRYSPSSRFSQARLTGYTPGVMFS